jgi:hypothetical protein
MKTTLAALLIATASLAHANIIDLGEIDLTGTFTLNHTYYFNPGSPYGTFSTMTVSSANGIFISAKRVEVGVASQ